MAAGIAAGMTGQVIRRRSSESVDAFTDRSEDLHPVLARCYANRGVLTLDDLGRRLDQLPTGEGMPGLASGASVIADAIRRQQRILIVGDYDADGATAAAVAVIGLRAMGANSVDTLVPDRQRHGYGLSPGLVREAVALAPDLIITVDNGIAAVDGVAAAKAHGWRVVVTDHHLPGDRLPDADALIDPCLPNSGFPTTALAGVGVMFYVLTAVRKILESEVKLASLLDLVALGTVADMVPLDRTNRILVHQGLRRIRAGLARPGIMALAELAGRVPARMSASDLAFGVAPRINAAGRLEDMSIGLACLLADDLDEASALANTLDAINRERRTVEADMRQQAEVAVEQHLLALSGELPDVLVLYDQRWHQGVVGLVAGRIKERFQRPVVAFAPGDGGELKGSMRSVRGVHARDLLARVESLAPGTIARFGGHAMAAGLSMRHADLDRFRAALDAAVVEVADAARAGAEIVTDGVLGADEMGLRLAESIRDEGPWGQAFPEPSFDGVFEVLERRQVGRGHLKLRVRAAGGGAVDAIAFGLWDHPLAQSDHLTLVYRLAADHWRGLPRLQLMVETLMPPTS
jgi:single-stranded-DNA-specific exonuclease